MYGRMADEGHQQIIWIHLDVELVGGFTHWKAFFFNFRETENVKDICSGLH